MGSLGLLDARLAIIGGKGGVGKTTVTAVLATAAHRSGRRVLVVELDGKPVLERLLPDVEMRHISAADALEEYLFEHGFRRIARRLASTGVIDVVSTAAPGIDDLVVLGKLKQLERSGEWDLIVVDGPAAGHAVTMLTSPAGLGDAIRSGPIRNQADEVLELLRDGERCEVVLVTTAETTPVNELFETAAALERRVGVRLGAVVVNLVDRVTALPDPAGADFGRSASAVVDAARAAGEFRRARVAAQAVELERVRGAHDRVVTLPAIAGAMSPAVIAELASELA